MINPTHIDEQVTLSRDVEVITIPFGTKTKLKKGEKGQITQALGGSYTVMIGGNLFRIDGKDADAIGKEQTEEIKKTDNSKDVGLIYSCEFKTKDNGNKLVDIKMTLTAPGCGMGPVIADEVKQKVKNVQGVDDINLELVWDPPWDQSMISEAARLEMGLL